jgi:hypothetical protein
MMLMIIATVIDMIVIIAIIMRVSANLLPLVDMRLRA